MGRKAKGTRSIGNQPKRRADGKPVDELFESPYLIRSKEAAADFSDIGNGRSAGIDAALAKIIDEIPAKPKLDVDEALGSGGAGPEPA